MWDDGKNERNVTTTVCCINMYQSQSEMFHPEVIYFNFLK